MDIYESHLAYVLRNADILTLYTLILEQWEKSEPIVIDLVTTKEIQDAYRREMMCAERELHQVTASFFAPFWGGSKMDTRMFVEGVCENPCHGGPVSLDVLLDADDIATLNKVDEELTLSYGGTCPTCKQGAIIDTRSWLEYKPRNDYVAKIVHAITTRIKSPDIDLAAKLTDMILGVDDRIRPNRVPVASQLYLDLYGIRWITASESACYQVKDYIASREDMIILQEKDYIRAPKPNGYQSLHLYVAIGGTPQDGGRLYEIQIRDEQMHDHAQNNPAAAHKHYAELKRLERAKLGSEWSDLHQTLAQLFKVS